MKDTKIASFVVLLIFISKLFTFRYLSYDSLLNIFFKVLFIFHLFYLEFF